MFISSFFQMARQRYYWSSPSRLARIVWSIATNIPRQLEILRILSLPLFSALTVVDPALPFKYLSTKYLLSGLPPNARAAAFLHHLRFVRTHLPAHFLRQRQQRAITIFETRAADSAFAVTLGFPAKNANLEGELCLRLLVDGVETYLLQFNVAPGSVLQSSEKDVFFILRLQGMKGCYEKVRAATKALGEVAPPALLIAALQGMADAWGVREMAGICARSQYCYEEQASPLFTEAYDNFFLELGATRTTAQFYSSPLPLTEKSVALITNGHRSRTLKKRAYKRQISDEVCRWWIANGPRVEDAHRAPSRKSGVRSRSRERSAA